MKPTVKPPGPKRLKVKCVVLLSASAFRFNMRRHTEAGMKRNDFLGATVGRCRLTLSTTLKAPRTQRLKLKCDEPLTNSAFKFNLRRYTTVLQCADAIQVRRRSSEETKGEWGGTSEDVVVSVAVDEVGRCRLTLSNPRRKRLELTA
jgi:hypothetical protein